MSTKILIVHRDIMKFFKNKPEIEGFDTESNHGDILLIASLTFCFCQTKWFIANPR